MKTKLFTWVSWIAFLVSAISEWGLDIDLPLSPALWLVMTAVVFCATNAPAALTTNSWADGNGKWELGINWDHGVPALSDSANVIVNAGGAFSTLTPRIDGATVASNALNGCMTISNLTLSVVNSLASETLLITNATLLTTPLKIYDTLTIGIHTSVIVSNAALQIGGTSAGAFSDDGALTMFGGTLIATNAGTTFAIGDTGNGRMTVLGGTWQTASAFVGYNTGSSGTLTMAGGTNLLSVFLDIGLNTGVNGTVWVTGGQLTVTNGFIEIGDEGVGQMTVSNGTWLAGTVDVSLNNGAQGTLTIAGGTNKLLGALNVAEDAEATGAVWLTGGQLTVTNDQTLVGDVGVGQMIVSNGTWLGQSVVVGDLAGSRGTLTLAGGTSQLTNILELGNFSGATGTVWVTGGQLTVTNDTSTVGMSGVGRMTVSNGTWLAQTVFVGNVAGSQGTLTIAGGTNVLSSFFTIGYFAGATGAVWMTDGQLTVTDDTAVARFGVGQMTVSNGTWLADLVLVGHLAGSQGTLTVAGGTNALSSHLYIGRFANATGTVWVTGGQLSNLATFLGSEGVGQMTVSNGTWLCFSSTAVGAASGSRGTLTVAGGTSVVSLGLRVGDFAGATGAVWVTGGQLMLTNSTVIVGNNGVGQMTVSNGTWRSSDVAVGANAGSQGTLTVAGGTNTMSVGLTVGNDPNANGAVWVTGGQLTMTNGTARVGNNGVGQMTVSNGTWLARGVSVGANAGAQGILTVAGGTSSVFSNLTIGNFPCAPTGTVIISGGNLFVTNATASAVLDVRTGSLILNSGVLTIDKLVMTNACGNFVHTGGTLVYGIAVLDPARDDDGDGLPNGWEQDHGLDPLDPSGSNGAAGDPDGDGQSNLAEYQAGTVPTVDIKSIAREGNDIRVTWQAAASKTNALQRTTGDANGSYSNNFADSFVVTNNVGGVTNYLDVNAATNFPSLFYRVRLVP